MRSGYISRAYVFLPRCQPQLIIQWIQAFGLLCLVFHLNRQFQIGFLIFIKKGCIKGIGRTLT